MNELGINCRITKKDDGQNVIGSVKVNVTVEKRPEENLLYKFIIGFNGTWNTVKDFTRECDAEWSISENGKYNIMVQAKREGSNRPFDYVSRMDCIAGNINEKFIEEITSNKEQYRVGDRVIINVESKEECLLYRYYLKNGNEWNMIKDYSEYKAAAWTVKTSGIKEILVVCRRKDSKQEFDDYAETSFEVLPLKKVELKELKCISTKLLVGSPLIFEAVAEAEEERNVLYKFGKVDSEGHGEIIQDYSSTSIISITEKKPGDYKLICAVKDMYSLLSYDSKVVINYSVLNYEKIVIKSFATNLSSPQFYDTPITLNADVSGGSELLYRFTIEGNESLDTGYIRENSFQWICGTPGKYNLTLYVKDTSSYNEYEASSSLEYEIDNNSILPPSIKHIVISKEGPILKNDTVNVQVAAEGGTEPRYSFIIRKKGEVLEQIEYGTCSFVNYTPEELGQYEMEVRVRDKFSKREFDSHAFINFDVVSYIPASIRYVILPKKSYYITGENIPVDIIIENSSDNLVKYVLRIDDRKVEESDFSHSTKYVFIPKRSGLYTLEVLAKNVNSDKVYDSIQEISIDVNDAYPITDTKICCDKSEFHCNETLNFSADNEGGREVVYEFYIMELNEWNIVQKYSRKNYYTFVPYSKGKYKILVLCKSSFKKCAYEDYDIMEFVVE